MIVRFCMFSPCNPSPVDFTFQGPWAFPIATARSQMRHSRHSETTCWGNSSETWVFRKIGVPQNEWLIMENPIRMDDLGVPLFLETPIFAKGCSHSQKTNIWTLKIMLWFGYRSFWKLQQPIGDFWSWSLEPKQSASSICFGCYLLYLSYDIYIYIIYHTQFCIYRL